MTLSQGKNPFEGVTLDPARAQEYDNLVDDLVRGTITEYEQFVHQQRRAVDRARWKPVKSRENVTVYKPLGSPSPPQVPPPTSSWAASASMSSSTSSPSSSTSSSYSYSGALDDNVSWGVPKMLCVGSIMGTVEDAVYGVFAPTTDEMLINAAYLHNEVAFSYVLQTIRSPTVADPLFYRGVKWIVAENPTKGTITRERDAVFLSGSGIHVQPNGDRVGYLVMHSIDAPEFPPFEMDKFVRGRLSNCCIFKQLAPNVVDVYMWSFIDTAGQMLSSITLKICASSMMACWKMTWCGQNKKLVWMLREAAAARRLAQDSTHGNGAKSASSTGSDCVLCQKRITMLRPRRRCDLCRCEVCARCMTTRKLVYMQPDGEVAKVPSLFCKSCLAMATNRNTSEVVRQIHVYAGLDGLLQGKRSAPAPQAASPIALLSSRSATLPLDGMLTKSSRDPLDSASESSDDGDWEPHTHTLSQQPPVPTHTTTSTPHQALEHQKQLWMRMNELCVAAEEAYVLTQKSKFAMYSASS